MRGPGASRPLIALASLGLLAALAATSLAACRGATPTWAPTATPVCVVAGSEVAAVAAAIAETASAQVSLSLDSYQGCIERVASGFAEAALVWGPEPEDNEAYITELVASDGLAIVVHPSNQVGPLSTEALRGIFAGRVSDWWEFGQSMGEVQPVTRSEGSGTRLAFAELVMGETHLSTGAVVVASDDAVLDYVAANPAAIGYVAASNLREGIRALRIGDERPEPQKVRDGLYPLMVGVWLVSRPTVGGDAAWVMVQSEAAQQALQQYLAEPEALYDGLAVGAP